MRKLLADSGGCGAVGLLLDDAGRFTAQIAQVIQLGAANLAAAHHGDRVDHRRHHGEYALDAFAVGNLANREALIEPAAGAADADAFIGLHARAVAFDHLDVNDHGVAGSEFRNGLAGGQFIELLFFELLNEVHRKISIGGAPSLSGAGSANVHLSCSAYSAKVDTGLAKEHAQFNKLEHFLTAIRITTLPENARCADLALVYGID